MEILTKNKRIIGGISEEQYKKVCFYLKEISKPLGIEKNFDYYFLGYGMVRTNTITRRIELTKDVDEEIFNSIKNIIKGLENKCNGFVSVENCLGRCPYKFDGFNISNVIFDCEIPKENREGLYKK